VYKPLEWRLNYEDVFRHAGIEGISWQWVGDHCCTNCGTCADILASCYCKDNPGIKIEPTEICFGADVIAKEDSEKVILIGDCAIRANKANKNGIRVKGCPPKISDSLITLTNNTLEKKRAKRIIATRIVKGLLNKFGIYNERFPREFSYELPEFDPKHF